MTIFSILKWHISFHPIFNTSFHSKSKKCILVFIAISLLSTKTVYSLLNWKIHNSSSTAVLHFSNIFIPSYHIHEIVKILLKYIQNLISICLLYHHLFVIMKLMGYRPDNFAFLLNWLWERNYEKSIERMIDDHCNVV